MPPDLRRDDKRWAVIECRHVVPLNDQQEHDLFAACWCRPRIEEPDDVKGYIVVHNSADGREEVERITGERVTVS